MHPSCLLREGFEVSFRLLPKILVMTKVSNYDRLPFRCAWGTSTTPTSFRDKKTNNPTNYPLNSCPVRMAYTLKFSLVKAWYQTSIRTSGKLNWGPPLISLVC